MTTDVLQHPAVRDLAWVMRSPGLLDAAYYAKHQHPKPHQTGAVIIDDGYCQQLYRQQHAWLRQLDQDPQTLLAWLAQRKSHRLGYYFEDLVEYWLRHLVADGFVASHVPVRRGKQTLGEFDFLFAQAGARALQHWEVAVKFYLAQRHADGRVLFYGPQARDRLDLKVARLLEHQAVLAHTDAGQAVIAQQGYASVMAQVLLKGYLFYPADMDWDSAPLPCAGISPTHLRGWWTRIDALQIPAASTASRWCRVPRLAWLAPVRVAAGHAQALVTQADLAGFCRDQFARRAEPFMLAELAAAEDGSWREISRGFVVHGHWPQADA